MERTLVLLKPDTLQRGLMGQVLTRFENAGLKVIGMKMAQPDEDHYHKHYEDISKLITRRGEDVYHRNAGAMMAGPVVAIVLEGVESIELVRKLVGDTEPKSAAPGTIRGDYAHMSMKHSNVKDSGLPNLVHASGNTEEAKQEIKLWFSDQELFEYKLSHQHLTQ